jgi:hypothetical protein
VPWGTATFQFKLAKLDTIPIIKVSVSLGLCVLGYQALASWNVMFDPTSSRNMVSMHVSID